MSNFNLNTVNGFNKLVGGVGGVSTLLTSLTGAIGSSWDIQEGSYGHDGKQVLFHVFKSSADFDGAVGQIQDTAGKRKVPIIFPYQDGQSTDDLGRIGETFDFDIVLFGPNYKKQYRDLLVELNKPEPGDLVHPVRGQIKVAAENWIVTHSSDKKQAVTLRVKFIEHSFSVDYSTIPVVENVPSALTKAIGFVSTISNIITAVQSVAFIVSNTRNLVTALLHGYLDGYTNVLSQLNRTYNTANANLIPGLNPTVAGQDPSVFGVATSPNNAFSGTGSIQSQQSNQNLTAALASQQAIDAVSALRTELESIILQIEATEFGQGELIFFDDILSLKQSAIAMQDVLELGLQSSKNTIVAYMTPRDMSAREICFANGLTPDDAIDIEILNPNLLSMNLIFKGTVVRVPT